MGSTVKSSFALWLSILLVCALLLPAVGFGAPAFAVQSGGTVQGNVYGDSGGVTGDVYGCKELTAPNSQGWRDLLKPVITKVSPSKIKVTFTMPQGFCKTLSFTSYAYQGNVKPLPNGGPFEAQYVFDNVTANYQPGSHTVEINLPCGYWQTDLYVGPVITKLNPLYGHPSHLMVNALKNDYDNHCPPIQPPVQPPVQPSLDLLLVTPLCMETGERVRFELSNRNGRSVQMTYSLNAKRGTVTLDVYETKTIELVSPGAGMLVLTLNGTSKNAAEANLTACSGSGTNPDNPGNPGNPGNPDNPGTPGNPGNPDNPGNPGSGSDSGDSSDSDSPTVPVKPQPEIINDKTPVPLGPAALPSKPVPGPGTTTVQPPAPGASQAAPTPPAALPKTGTGTSEPTPPAEVKEEGTIPAGYAVLPQTGEQPPWLFYWAGAMLILIGAWSGLRQRRRGH